MALQRLCSRELAPTDGNSHSPTEFAAQTAEFGKQRQR